MRAAGTGWYPQLSSKFDLMPRRRPSMNTSKAAGLAEPYLIVNIDKSQDHHRYPASRSDGHSKFFRAFPVEPLGQFARIAAEEPLR
ncbi:hypothetical protein CPLU01_12530 [Colletotrichum plurivorum]|uniref:Uncharacterized protein n=1 Tax=Colletotrichum plurivorum TaxID=2175906 RepID=A0A8H6JZ77_9PEZI|nr:hypothetical protein CPLU01_12530 [Colletotrichum plurivorum]